MTDLPPLAQFLRSRRERLTPAEAGVKVTGRRRTPGLRREEVATLAGVSIDYLVRLEQGRDTNPSPDVLLALAEALHLDGDETRHLLALAALSAAPQLDQHCPPTPALDVAVPETVRFLLAQLDPTPAFVVDPIGDVLAANTAWQTLTRPLGLHDVPNLARHVFTHPEARTIYRSWDAVADDEVVRLRTAHRQLEHDPALVTLLAELLDVASFARRWEAHPVTARRRGAEQLRHPDAGDLRLTAEVLRLADHDRQLIVWLPADDATAEALRRVLSGQHPLSPAHLRVVGDS